MFLLFLFLSSVFVSSDAQGAWLLASKNPISNYGVEGMEYIVSYGLYNVGDRPATKITLDDRASFPSQAFTTIQGDLQMSVSRVNPGENVTHLVILRPLFTGLFNSTSAQISYRPDVNSKELRSGLTTTNGEVYIYRRVDYEMKFGSKAQYFFVFFALMTPGFLCPFFYYVRSTRKYANEEQTTTKNNQETTTKTTAKTTKKNTKNE